MSIARLLLPVALLLPLAPAWGQGFFMPPAAQQPAAGQHQAPPRQAPVRQAPRTSSTVQPLSPPPGPVSAGPAPDDSEPPPPPQAPVQLPPPPELPTMPKGVAPPAAAIGVLGIPEVMRASSAAQQVEKAVTERREKLNQDAQKEQAVWRDMQQALANQRASLSPEQIRTRERELQERITNAQRVFRDRNRIIQEAGQYGLAQIERMLIAVIRQVADSRSMNLVLHRAQVALNVNEFDITDQVTSQLNKVLPTVLLPPEGVSPSALAPPPAAPATVSAPGTPAPSPAPAAPATPAPASAPAPTGAAPRR